MDRTATVEYEIPIPAEAWPDEPPVTLRVVPRLMPAACDVDLARAGSDPGIDEGEPIAWLADEDVTEDGL